MSFNSNIRNYRDAIDDIRRRLFGPEHRYHCCMCDRDVRIAGGSSSEASALCNRCFSRISAVDQCDFCGWGTSTMQIRIVDTSYNFVDVGENDDFPGLGEQYRTCHECFRKLAHPNHQFFDHVLRTKCQFCDKRFGLCNVRFMDRDQNAYQSQRCCTKCLPSVRERAEQWNRRYQNHVMEEPPVSNIEIKDNICYVWNPRELEMKRDHTLASRTMMDVRVDIGGAATRPDLSNAVGCRRAFIYDGDIIWILKKCMLDSHVDTRGRDASFYTISYYLHFVVLEFETRNATQEMERHQTRRLDNSGRDAYHNQLYTNVNDVIESIGSLIATGSDWAANTGPEGEQGVPGVRGIEGHSGERVELNESGLNADRTLAFPRTFTAIWNSPIETEPSAHPVIDRIGDFRREFTLDYNRAIGNNVNTPVNDVAVWCSCGFRGTTTSTNNDFRHSHMHVNVKNGLSGPGSRFTMNVGSHTLNFMQAGWEH